MKHTIDAGACQPNSHISSQHPKDEAKLRVIPATWQSPVLFGEVPGWIVWVLPVESVIARLFIRSNTVLYQALKAGNDSVWTSTIFRDREVYTHDPFGAHRVSLTTAWATFIFEYD
jgi:hypothetical protein